MLDERAINDERVSSPTVLLVLNVFVPEAIIIVIVVNRCQERRTLILLGIRIWLDSEVGHNFFHLRLHLILSNIKLVFHDLRSLAISAVLIEPLSESLHSVPLSHQLFLLLIDPFSQLLL